MNFLGFFYIHVMFINRDSFTSSLLIKMPFFLVYLPCLDPPIQWWIEVVRADGHPCLATGLREKAFSPLPLSMLAVGFSQVLFMRLTKFSFIFWVFLLWNGIGYCQMFVSTLWFLSFILSIWRITLTVLCWTLHSWEEFHLVIVYNPIYILLDLVHQYFVKRIFAST